MCEVTRSSFDKLFPVIEQTIKKADFIALDSEFTGLHVRETDRPSLFDTSEERYKKLRNSVSRLTLCQIGVSAFIKDQFENVYEAHTFTFHLFPMSFGPVNPTVTWQASSFEFLRRFNFDFNKCVYKGLSFLNDEQERQLCQGIDSGLFLEDLDRQYDESFIQSLCSKVAQWYVTCKEGETLTLHKTNADAKLWNAYVIHTEIRRRFPLVWTVTDSFQNVAVEKVSEERRKQLDEENARTRGQEQEKLKESMLGFTKVFRVIREYQKVLVGHNMLMDLLFLYDKFFRPLPVKYETFKKNIHDLFPRIYDTKQMSFLMKKTVEELTGGVYSTNLIQLYRILNRGCVTYRVRKMPVVKHAKGFERYKDQDCPHEAGFDAYMCGHSFIRICHLLRFKDNVDATVQNSCPFRIYLAAAKPQCNQINIIRATVSHIQLDGKDPPSRRPQLLFVRCRKKGQRLNQQQLAEWMSACGMVDIQLLSSSTAMVAAGNFTSARSILSTFRRHPQIRVSNYRFWRHSPVGKGLMWCGLLVSGGACVWAVMSLLQGD